MGTSVPPPTASPHNTVTTSQGGTIWTRCVSADRIAYVAALPKSEFERTRDDEGADGIEQWFESEHHRSKIKAECSDGIVHAEVEEESKSADDSTPPPHRAFRPRFGPPFDPGGDRLGARPSKYAMQARRNQMRALVVYESMYGNTHDVARHIADGLRPTFEVTVMPAARTTPEDVAEMDLVVVGSPTHVHGLPRRSTRRAAAEAALQAGGELELDADAVGRGVREWFDEIGDHQSGLAAAFDTRIDMSKALTGRASRGIERRLRHRGFDVVAESESFLVDKKNRLLAGEEQRAMEWGRTLAASLAARFEVGARRSGF